MARKPRIIDTGPYRPSTNERAAEAEMAKALGLQGFSIVDDVTGLNIHTFEFGTIHGRWILRNKPSEAGLIEILLVVNKKRGNGCFRQFMGALIARARRTRRSVHFLHVMNQGLRNCLYRDYGFRESGEHMVWEFFE